MIARMKGRPARADPRQRALALLEILLIAALAIASARLVWTILTPPGPLGDWRATSISPPPAPAPGAFDPFTRGAVDPDPVRVASVGLTLHGVRQDRATGRGAAILGRPGGEQASFVVGEEVAPGIVLAGIGFDHVVLDQAGERSQLFLDQSVPATAVAPAPPAAPANTEAARELLAGVEVTPRIEGGRVAGYALRAAGSGEVFRRAGFEPGDVLVSVAGQPVGAIGDPAALAAELGAGAATTVEVERDGRRVSLRVAR